MKNSQRFTYFLFIFCAFAKTVSAQKKSILPPATTSADLIETLAEKDKLEDASLFKNVPFHNVGPTIMSGRVVDVEVNPENSTEFYVGYATGGVWYTNNNGITFTSVFDSAPTQNVGDIAIDWKTGTIWVGTGETISSRSSYAGIGILKSTDHGKTWQNKGLVDGHHISDIIIDPANPEVVYVAVLGHLYTPNAERGVYKTTDGGNSWAKTLFVSDDTGIISLVMAPDNPNVLYAAAWDRDRKAWDFRGSGKESGIFKSVDAGETWSRVTTGNGFPEGDGTGRIGLAVVDENTIYAVHDSQFKRPVEAKKEEKGLKPEDFKKMSIKNFLKLDDKELDTYLKSKRFERDITAEIIKKKVEDGEYVPLDLYKFVTDENSVSEESEVVGAEIYLTEDGGKSWHKTHEGYIDDLFYSYGYVFAEITVSPQNKNHLYLIGVPIVKSKDGGKTFTYINEPNLHVDHHVVWVDPNLPGHLINGNDGGLNISYDDGASWTKNNSMPLGQFYAIDVDYQEPYNIYGGLQDNGTWMGPSTYTFSKGWEADGQYAYKNISGGDGFQVEIDKRDPNVVYCGSQFGFYNRFNLKTNERKSIRPSHSLGESPYRFNWQTPILLSPHNQDILYLGSNKLMRSMNRGDDWTPISPDLTTGGKKGNVPYGTITTISESPFQFGLLYTGSDDGKIYISKDTGGAWKDISSGLPQNLWVSRVVASQHKKGRVYATLNGYRYDDFKPYVYVSEDYGATWKQISNSLPSFPVNVIIEDPVKADYLYLGTDNGAYISVNQGGSWQIFDNEMPKVAVHDMVIQTKANDLVIGTHGRSIFITNLDDLQQWDATKTDDLQLFAVDPIDHSTFWGRKWSSWSEGFSPKETVVFYSPKAGNANIDILDADEKVLTSITQEAVKGFNYIDYDLAITEAGKDILVKEHEATLSKADDGKFYLPPGKYEIKLSVGDKTKQTPLEIVAGKGGRNVFFESEEEHE